MGKVISVLLRVSKDMILATFWANL